MGLDEKQFEALKREIKRAYHSISSPRFDFVALAIKSNPYAQAVEDMRAIGEILEDTDPNDDVSFGYLITTPIGKYCIRISMVGPYALIMGPPKNELISDGIQSRGSMEKRLLEVIVDAGILVLDVNDLARIVSLRLPNGKTTNVFQALFSDSDFFPWEIATDSP